ncbi:MAG: isochorismatase family protein [Arsenophonus endosymbiont of Dermacentor nuttalli]
MSETKSALSQLSWVLQISFNSTLIYVRLIIDLQNDYFPGEAFPLNNTESTLCSIVKVIGKAKGKGIPVVLVQHVTDPTHGIVPFFNKNSEGVKIHSKILTEASDAPIIIKHFADSFEDTKLHETLQQLNVDELILCGMMTQNCVTHTTLSRRADDYKKVTVLTDVSITVSEMLHRIALHALSTCVALTLSEDILNSHQIWHIAIPDSGLYCYSKWKICVRLNYTLT